MPAGAGRSATYYSQAMAALPPRPARRRPRPGSLERPVSGRLYRGTWLLVGIPLLLATFTVRKADPLPVPQPSLPATFDRTGALDARERALRELPRSRARHGGRSRRRQLVRPAARAVRAPARRRTLPRRPPRPRDADARQPGAHDPGPATERDRRDGPQGRQRNRAGSQRQRLRDRRAPRARPLLRNARRRARQPGAEPAAHARLRRDRRRRLRRPRRPPLRRHPRGARARRCRSRRDRRARSAAPRPRRGPSPASHRRGSWRPPPSGSSSRPASGRTALRRLRSSIDLAFPFTLHEQGPLLAARPSGPDPDHRRRAPAVAVLRPAVPARPEPPRRARPRRAAAPELARLRRRAGAGDGELRLLRAADPAGLGDRAGADRGAGAVPGRRGRSLRALPADGTSRSRPPCGATAAAPGSGSGRSRSSSCSRWPASGRAAPAVPLPPDSSPASDWPVFGLLGLALLVGIGWFVTRERLLPRRPVSPSEELAGTAAALLALGVVALLVVATNPFALIFLLPSAACMAMASAGARPGRSGRARRLLAAGFIGPAAAARLVGVPLRARARLALVSRRAGGDRLRRPAGHRYRRRLARRRRPGGRALGGSLRAVPDSRGAAAARADPGDSQAYGRAYS